LERLIPRKFLKTKFEEWQSQGYQVIDFTQSEVDLNELPEYYKEKYESTERKIEKNYLLNHLLYHNLVSYIKVLNRYIFKALKSPLIYNEIPCNTVTAHQQWWAVCLCKYLFCNAVKPLATEDTENTEKTNVKEFLVRDFSVFSGQLVLNLPLIFIPTTLYSLLITTK